MSRRPDTLKTVNLQPSIEEDGESAGLYILMLISKKDEEFFVSS